MAGPLPDSPLPPYNGVIGGDAVLSRGYQHRRQALMDRGQRLAIKNVLRPWLAQRNIHLGAIVLPVSMVPRPGLPADGRYLVGAVPRGLFPTAGATVSWQQKLVITGTLEPLVEQTVIITQSLLRMIEERAAEATVIAILSSSCVVFATAWWDCPELTTDSVVGIEIGVSIAPVTRDALIDGLADPALAPFDPYSTNGLTAHVQSVSV